MAYITKSEVQAKSIKLKQLNKQYDIKSRFSGSNSSTLVLTVVSGGIDFVSNRNDCWKLSQSFDQHIANTYQESQYITTNHYYLNSSFCGIALEYLEKAYAIMLEDHYGDSDSMRDYFNCAWYNKIQIGNSKKGYVLTN